MNFRRKGEQKYMKKRIVFELAAGILILVSALYTYVPKSQYMYELTFISNMAGAGLLLTDAIYASVKRKWLPSVLFFIFYSNGTVWPKIWLK